MGQDKWCQIIDLLLARTRKGPQPQHRIWLWEEERGPKEGAATWKRDNTPWPPLGPSPRRGPMFSCWMTQLPRPHFPEIVLPGFLIISTAVPTSPTSWVLQEQAQSLTHPNAPVPPTRPVGAKQMPETKV